eukprot:1678189-Amphidinium_carterae.1
MEQSFLPSRTAVLHVNQTLDAENKALVPDPSKTRTFKVVVANLQRVAYATQRCWQWPGG